MALTYSDSDTLSTDIKFRGRIKIACLHFAQYIVGEAANVPAHNTRYRWAQDTMRAPDQTAGQIQSAVIMQPPVQEQGDKISDADLQTAVETTLNSIL